MLSRSRLFGVLCLSACSFTQGAVDECAIDDDCREAFGVGSVCLDSGFCASADSEPRCETAWPVDLEENPDDYPDIVLVGTIIDDSQVTHVARAKSVELAVRDANESGGVNGRQFGLVVCTNRVDPAVDSRNQNEASVAVADFLAQLGVVAVVGPPSSDAAEAVFEQASPDLLFVSPSASSEQLSMLSGPSTDEAPGRFWRTTAPDAEQARRIAANVSERGLTRLAIVHADNAYGNGIATVVQESLPAAVEVELFPYATQGRLSEITAEVGRTEAEEILLASSVTSEVTAFLQAAADSARYDERSFFLTDAAANRDLIEGISAHPALFPRLRGTRPELPDAVTLDAFYARYNLTFGEDVRDLSFTSNSYDAAWVTLYSIAWAILQEDAISAITVGRGLRRLSDGVEAPIRMSTWTNVVDAFSMGDSVDVTGTSGRLDFDPSTREITGGFVFWTVDASGIIPL